MATIPCNEAQMSKAFCKFMREIGFKGHSQESIKGLHKGLVLHYLGLTSPTEEQRERWAMAIHVATQNAYQRGWDL